MILTDRNTYEPDDRVISSLGFDAALRHGALVHCDFHFSPSRGFTRLRSLNVIYQWGKRHKLALSSKSRPTDIQRLGNMVLSDLDARIHKPTPLGVDFDASSVYWSKRSIFTVQVAYFLGYLTRGFQERGHAVTDLRPIEVRKALRLPQGAEKLEVWSMFCRDIIVEDGMSSQVSDRYSDIADAIILAYLVAKAKKELQLNDGQQYFTLSLSGS